MPEITHTLDDDGCYVQIVPGWRLREMLRDDGEPLARPSHFTDDDEWDVGDDARADDGGADVGKRHDGGAR